MSLSLPKEQKSEAVESLRRFMASEFDHEMSEMQAGFLLEYFLKEVGPYAYNRGVEDAQKHLARLAEDLTGTCFEEPLTYWKSQGGSRGVRRKPER